MGIPCSRSPKATPTSSGARRLPAISAALHLRRHSGLSRLPRSTIATPRRMRATSSRMRARYMAENMVAYQPGKAANMPAAATISHTSLPSHTGPMVPSAVCLPASSPPRTPCSIPTPKSKPSRTRKPIHRAAIRTNQNSARVIATSVGELEDLGALRRFLRYLLRLVERELPAGVVGHQPPVDGAHDRVEHHERDQAGDDPGGADVGGVGVLHLLQALHDPRLAAFLGEHPAGDADDERHRNRPDGRSEEPLR